MVGNLDTLCRPEAHRANGLGGKLPEEVFASLKKISIRHAEYNNIDKLKQNGISPGHIFKNCPITIKKDNKNQPKCVFSTRLAGNEEYIKFTFPAKPYGSSLLKDGECFDFKYKYSQDSDRPLFEIIPQKVEATIIDYHNNIGTIKLSDSSTRKVIFDNHNRILKQMLSGYAYQLAIPLLLKGHFASLDSKELQQRINNLSGNRFVVQIISIDTNGYWCWCPSEKVIGFVVNRRLPLLYIGDTLDCSVYMKKKESITFNYLRKRL